MYNIGRFAPSPSGRLHFGSFVTALGSYLQVKSKKGLWLVRIEDLDPPREVEGAATDILYTLEKLGLYWDKEVIYQSQRLERYQEILNFLSINELVYHCDCARQRIQHLPSLVYDNHCRTRQLIFDPATAMAIRLKQTIPISCFIDNIRQRQIISKVEQFEDFVIKRRDGLFAYNFAVVIDDHDQGVTEVVRGADLLPVTTKQISLYQLLNWSVPSYYHLPLALNSYSNKLSKQNHAPTINLDNINQLIIDGLQFLGQPTPIDWQDASKEQLLQWGIAHWHHENIPQYDQVVLTADK